MSGGPGPKRLMERERARGQRLLDVVREDLERILALLIAGGARDTAEGIASAIGTAVWRELGDEVMAEARTAAGAGDLRRATDDCAAKVREMLARHGVTPEQLARECAEIRERQRTERAEQERKRAARRAGGAS